jgi:hypothetical protein
MTVPKSQLNEYLESFVFGSKVITLLLVLALPVVLWGWLMLGLVPRVIQSSLFESPPVVVLGVYRDEVAAKKDRNKSRGRVVYEVTYENGDRSYVLTSGGNLPDDQEEELGALLGRLREDYQRVFSESPVWFEGKIPLSRRIVIDRKTSTSGRVAEIFFRVFGTIFCLALYFPLGKAIIKFFKKKKEDITASPRPDTGP